MTKSKFKYRSRTTDDLEKSQKQIDGSWDSYIKSDFPLFKPSEGKNNIRILPATWEDTEKWKNSFGIIVHTHYGIGADNTTYLCPEKMKFSKSCPICDERTRVQNSGDKDYLSSLYVSRRLLVYLIDRDNEEVGPLIWAIPKTVASEIIDESKDIEDNEALPIDNPDEGYDISFIAVKAGKRNCEYRKIRLARDPSTLFEDDDYTDEVLSFLMKNPLPEVLNCYDAEYIENKFLARESEQESEQEDNSSTRRGSRRPNKDEDDRDSDDRDSDDSDDKDSDDFTDRRPRRSKKDKDDEKGSKTNSRQRLSRFKNQQND